MPGATVNLYDADGDKIGTTVTNARGEYSFDSASEGLVAGGTYTVTMDNPADYQEGGPLHGWEPTGSPYPAFEVTPGGPGENDHSIDFGFRK